MIQRIQTVFLLAAVALTGSLFFLDLATLVGAEQYKLIYRGIYPMAENSKVAIPTIALAILVASATLVGLITIFLFKKRMIQIRLCGLNLGLLLGTTVMIYFLGHQSGKELTAEVSCHLPIVFPLIGMVMTFMAMRAIGKDEVLVKSMDRIR